MSESVIYHGSEKVIKKPDYALGNLHNDYGKGFYCTEDAELGKEWACKNNTPGILNEYELELSDLKVLRLNKSEYNILNWIALLLKHRTFDINSPITVASKEYILKNFSIDTSSFDVIIGYRADDSYFHYAKDFISNSLSLRSLNRAMKLGNLGQQIVLVSPDAFARLSFKGYTKVNRDEYFTKFARRDSKARNDYQKLLSNEKFNKNDLYISDIMRKEMKNGDVLI